MKRLLSYFLRGLILTVPAVVTGYVCYQAFIKIDSWLGLAIPGAGFAATLGLITLIGFLGSSLITAGLVTGFESLLARLPLVRLVYSSTKDLLNAFVGETRRARARVHYAGIVRRARFARLGGGVLSPVVCFCRLDFYSADIARASARCQFFGFHGLCGVRRRNEYAEPSRHDRRAADRVIFAVSPVAPR
jgi:hypothetical protein